MSDSNLRASNEWVEVTGADVWEAIKTGLKLAFFTAIVAAVVVACTTDSVAEGGFAHCVCLFTGWVVGGTVLYLPLRLGLVATANCRGFLPGLLRFTHGLVVFVSTAALVLVLLARLLISIAHFALKVGG